ncbi:MAG: hypothetical protein Q8S53_03125 [Brevundimonas sp.]|uniref:hypothetical protein n=1 Tax=Brevundimonas sp. TaxID=1871086 RepID=UPI002733AEA7|nr:hypothetical protein [Brevundimonas sp.]MDP3377331.1 hypothetical protein [Brevundimonas sp.]
MSRRPTSRDPFPKARTVEVVHRASIRNAVGREIDITVLDNGYFLIAQATYQGRALMGLRLDARPPADDLLPPALTGPKAEVAVQLAEIIARTLDGAVSSDPDLTT